MIDILNLELSMKKTDTVNNELFPHSSQENSRRPNKRTTTSDLEAQITQKKKIELLAQRAESDAAGAKYHAGHANDRAEKVKVTIQGCLHKINVETETINSLKKKVGMIKERQQLWVIEFPLGKITIQKKIIPHSL
jgi:hypothetical protein